jgi:hypothetical protein
MGIPTQVEKIFFKEETPNEHKISGMVSLIWPRHITFKGS